MMSWKYILMILFVISCSIHATAQDRALTPGGDRNRTFPNETLFNQQWGLYNSYYSGIDISVISAWNYTTGKNIKFAIIDKGVAQEHTDLASNIDSSCSDAGSGSTHRKLYEYGVEEGMFPYSLIVHKREIDT